MVADDKFCGSPNISSDSDPLNARTNVSIVQGNDSLLCNGLLCSPRCPPASFLELYYFPDGLLLNPGVAAPVVQRFFSYRCELGTLVTPSTAHSVYMYKCTRRHLRRWQRSLVETWILRCRTHEPENFATS